MLVREHFVRMIKDKKGGGETRNKEESKSSTPLPLRGKSVFLAFRFEQLLKSVEYSVLAQNYKLKRGSEMYLFPPPRSLFFKVHSLF